MFNQIGEAWQEWWKSQEKLFRHWQETAAQFQPDKAEETSGEKGKDLWQDWWKAQGKLFNSWMEQMSKFQPEKTGDFFDPKNWGLSDKTAKLYQDWHKMTMESLEEYMKWLPSGLGKETFDKVLQGSDINMKLFSLWNDITDNLHKSYDLEKWRDFSKSWLKNYHRVLDSFFSSQLPEPFKKLFKNAMESVEIYQKTFYNFFQPWLDSSGDLREKFKGVFKGDREAYADFLRTWREVYQQTYGKIFRVPAFGLSRESFEKLMGSMDTYLQYLAAVNEFTATLYKIGYEAMEDLLKKFRDLYARGKAPKSFKEFYQMWWQANEEAYFELFKTDSFARLQGEVVDAQVRFKKRYDEWLEEFFRLLPVPTNNEMDSLYKTVYDLKKTIREQGKKIDKLCEKLKSLGKGAEATS